MDENLLKVESSSPKKQVVSSLGTSRYGRTRKPKISADFCDIDEAIESAISATPCVKSSKSPVKHNDSPSKSNQKANISDNAESIPNIDTETNIVTIQLPIKNPVRNSDLTRAVFQKPSEINFNKTYCVTNIKVHPPNSFERTTNIFKTFDIAKNVTIAGYKNNVSDGVNTQDLTQLSNVFEATPIDVSQVLKIITSKTASEVNANTPNKKSPKVLKTYVNKRKIINQQKRVIESFGLPDEPIVPMFDDKKTVKPLSIKELDVSLPKPEQVTLLGRNYDGLWEVDTNDFHGDGINNVSYEFGTNDKSNNVNMKNKENEKTVKANEVLKLDPTQIHQIEGSVEKKTIFISPIKSIEEIKQNQLTQDEKPIMVDITQQKDDQIVNSSDYLKNAIQKKLRALEIDYRNLKIQNALKSKNPIDIIKIKDKLSTKIENGLSNESGISNESQNLLKKQYKELINVLSEKIEEKTTLKHKASPTNKDSNLKFPEHVKNKYGTLAESYGSDSKHIKVTPETHKKSHKMNDHGTYKKLDALETGKSNNKNANDLTIDIKSALEETTEEKQKGFNLQVTKQNESKSGATVETEKVLVQEVKKLAPKATETFLGEEKIEKLPLEQSKKITMKVQENLPTVFIQNLTEEEIPGISQKKMIVEEPKNISEQEIIEITNESATTTEEIKVGDLMWSKIGNFPYWPCLITREPESKQFTKTLKRSKLYHVRFFGDNGRRSWTQEKHLMQFCTIEELKNLQKKLKCEVVIPVEGSKQERNWVAGISEANKLLNKTKKEKLEFFRNISQKKRIHTRKRKKTAYIERKKQKRSNNSVKLKAEVKEEKEEVLNLQIKKRLTRLSEKRDKVEVKQENTAPFPIVRKYDKDESENDDDSNSSFQESFPLTMEDQMTLYKRNKLFTRVSKDRICLICRKPGIVLKCKGRCCGYYHVDCAKISYSESKLQINSKINIKEISKENDVKSQTFNGHHQNLTDKNNKNNVATESMNDDTGLTKRELVPLNQEKVEIIDIKDRKKITPIDLTLEDDAEFKNLPMSEQLDHKMQEVMQPLIDKPLYLDSTTDSSVDDSSAETSTQANKLKSKSVENDADKSKGNDKELEFKCKNCLDDFDPLCFVCHKETSRHNSNIRQRCSLNMCGKFYHPECLKVWPQTQWSVISSTKHKLSDTNLDTFVCPAHVCHTCVSDDPRASISRCESKKLVKCLECPATYHTTSCCVPAGTEIFSSAQIKCPRHCEIKYTKKKAQPTINTTWCSICSYGGSLICCETCPTSVHVECMNINYTDDDKFICEDCETGRFPLYDEIVWVKLGSYRWWPAVILYPNEVPDNVKNLPHNWWEFVVKFFGTYDHYWIHKGRVFLFEEGDSGGGGGKSTTKKVDAIFKRSVEEATVAHQLKKEFKETLLTKAASKSKNKPPPYIKIKVNRPVGNVRQFDGNISNTTPCECDPNHKNPCGADSDCLNRLLLTECDPDVCPAGERCQNQRFEKRNYPHLLPYKTDGRGWGLRSLDPIVKGQFVIEYVGEMIDEKEYQRRIKKMHEQKEENYYFLTIDKDRMIDAGPKGNVARFMNHSCQPNCETQKWTVNGDTRVGLFAVCDIPLNTELTFNYNLECVGKEKKICRCGAPKCSGFIGVKVKQDAKRSRKRKLKKKKIPRLAKIKENRKPCFVCGNLKNVKQCFNKICEKFYHPRCVNLNSWPDKWTCPSHNCNKCSKRTIRCCVKCNNSYCPPHSNGNIRHDKVLGYICVEHDPSRVDDQAATVQNGSKSLEIEDDVMSPDTVTKKVSIPTTARKNKRSDGTIKSLEATRDPIFEDDTDSAQTIIKKSKSSGGGRELSIIGSEELKPLSVELQQHTCDRVTSTAIENVNSYLDGASEPPKRKRGRPRKTTEDHIPKKCCSTDGSPSVERYNLNSQQIIDGVVHLDVVTENIQVFTSELKSTQFETIANLQETKQDSTLKADIEPKNMNSNSIKLEETSKSKNQETAAMDYDLLKINHKSSIAKCDSNSKFENIRNTATPWDTVIKTAQLISIKRKRRRSERTTKFQETRRKTISEEDTEKKRSKSMNSEEMPETSKEVTNKETTNTERNPLQLYTDNFSQSTMNNQISIEEGDSKSRFQETRDDLSSPDVTMEEVQTPTIEGKSRRSERTMKLREMKQNTSSEVIEPKNKKSKIVKLEETKETSNPHLPEEAVNVEHKPSTMNHQGSIKKCNFNSKPQEINDQKNRKLERSTKLQETKRDSEFLDGENVQSTKPKNKKSVKSEETNNTSSTVSDEPQPFTVEQQNQTYGIVTSTPIKCPNRVLDEESVITKRKRCRSRNTSEERVKKKTRFDIEASQRDRPQKIQAVRTDQEESALVESNSDTSALRPERCEAKEDEKSEIMKSQSEETVYLPRTLRSGKVVNISVSDAVDAQHIDDSENVELNK